MRNLLGVRTVRLHGPDLRRSTAIRDEYDAPGVGHPTRALTVRTLRGDALRRAAVNWHHENPFRFSVLIEIDGLDGECDRFSIVRNLRLTDSRDLHHRVNIE